jgi:hypothetical protein
MFRRKHDAMVVLVSWASSIRRSAHAGTGVSRHRPKSPPTSLLQQSYLRIFPVAIHESLSATRNPQRLSTISDAVLHLVNASRWGLAADGDDFVRHVLVRAEPDADLRALRIAFAAQLSSRISGTFYSSTTPFRHQRETSETIEAPPDSATGRSASSSWYLAVQVHMSATAADGAAKAAPSVERAPWLCPHVRDDYAGGFAADDGIAPAADAMLKVRLLTHAPMLRSVVMGFCGLRHGKQAVSFAHAVHVVACALLLTMVPARDLVNATQRSAAVGPAWATRREELHRREQKRAKCLDSYGVRACDLEEVLLHFHVHSNASNATSPAAAAAATGQPNLVALLRTAAGGQPGHRRRGGWHQGAQRVKRLGVPTSAILRRSHGNGSADRVIHVDGDDDATADPFTMQLYRGAFPNAVTSVEDRAVATLLYASTGAAHRLRDRIADNDVSPRVASASIVELHELAALIGGWLQQSQCVGVHVSAYLQLVCAVRSLRSPSRAVGAESATAFDAQFALALSRLCVDLDAQDPAIRSATATCEVLLADLHCDSEAASTVVSRTTADMVRAVRMGMQRPAPRSRWETAVGLMAFAGISFDAAAEQLLLALSRARRNVTTPISAWDVTLRVAASVFESDRTLPQRSPVVFDAITRIVVQPSASRDWRSALAAVAVLLQSRSTTGSSYDSHFATPPPEKIAASATLATSGTAYSLCEALARVVPVEQLAAVWRSVDSAGFALDEASGMPLMLSAARAGDGETVKSMLLGSSCRAPVAPAHLSELALALQYTGGWQHAVSIVSCCHVSRGLDATAALGIIAGTSALEGRPEFILAALAATCVACPEGTVADAIARTLAAMSGFTPGPMQRVFLQAVARAAVLLPEAIDIARREQQLRGAPSTTGEGQWATARDVLSALAEGRMDDPRSISDELRLSIASDLPRPLQLGLLHFGDSLGPMGWSTTAITDFNRVLMGTASLGTIQRRWSFTQEREGTTAVGAHTDATSPL